MHTTPVFEVENIIKDYIQYQSHYLSYHKKKNAAEKEYNKLLVISGGEDKNLTLVEAEMIYMAYREMLINDEESKIAEKRFIEAEEKLKEIGRILFQASITAEISIPQVNGTPHQTRQVMITYQNGEVVVR